MIINKKIIPAQTNRAARLLFLLHHILKNLQINLINITNVDLKNDATLYNYHHDSYANVWSLLVRVRVVLKTKDQTIA